MMMPRVLVCTIAGLMSVAAAALGADTITTTGGERIVGKVTSFTRDHDTAAGSMFVIVVDGEEMTIPLRKIDGISFGEAAAGAPARIGSDPVPRRSAFGESRPKSASASDEDGEGGKHWLSSTGKRHNASCRYHGSGKGRPCGPTDGVPCKLCGG